MRRRPPGAAAGRRVRDLAFIGFLLALLGLGLRRPFLFVLAYAYVDIVAPQRLTYYLLNAVPLSLIVAMLAAGGWLLADDRRGARIAPRQIVILLLLGWCGVTTGWAAFPVEAADKWDWVWKALAFTAFLPLTLRTRLRMEALALFMTLSVASIIIVGGIKTLLSGGGYGALNLMVDNNSGLYEGSTISTVAIALVPLILHLRRHGTIYPPDGRVRLFAAALIFACLILPVGTEARTGLVCIGVLGLLMLRDVRHRGAYLGALAAAVLVAAPLLPDSFTQRMGTITEYKADQSASTRLAVWRWTWDFAREHPLGGGFEAYRANRVVVATERTAGIGNTVEANPIIDKARAYHSAYFEMLGEQGFPGLLLWLAIQLGGLWRMEVIRRRYARAGPEDGWIASLATALQHAQIIYLVGAAFVAIAVQPFMLMLIGLQIGLDGWLKARDRGARRHPFVRPRAPAPAA